MDHLEAALLKRNHIPIMGEVTPEMSNKFVSSIYYKCLNPKTKQITILIDSTGGSIEAALGMYDAMKAAEKSGVLIKTVCIGDALSAGAFLLVSGTQRYAAPNSTIMMHNVSFWLEKDYDRNNNNCAKHMSKSIERFYQTMANECYRYKSESEKSKLKDLKRAIKDSIWLTSDEAVGLGWVDGIWEGSDFPARETV